jgi:hypothetical protein
MFKHDCEFFNVSHFRPSLTLAGKVGDYASQGFKLQPTFANVGLGRKYQTVKNERTYHTVFSITAVKNFYCTGHRKVFNKSFEISSSMLVRADVTKEKPHVVALNGLPLNM